MKKIFLFSLVMCMGFVDVSFAGGFNDIKFRRSSVLCDFNDCLEWNGNYLMCDDDNGDVGDHVFEITQAGKYLKDFTAHECCLETTGDLWRGRSGRFLWCDKADTCKETVAFDYGFEFCAKSRTRDMGNKRPLLVDGGKKTENNQTTIKQYVGCLRCRKGYERPDKDYDFTSRDGCAQCKVTRNECVTAGMIDCLKAIDRGETANWNGKSCNCGSRDGVNYSWDSNQKKCVAEKTPKKTCKELYNNYPERIKCCEAGKTTYWEPKNDLINGKCYCYDKTTAWDSKTGKCVKQTNVSCEDAYKGNTEAVACCEAGENWIDGKCECDENKNWKYDEKAKTGKCIDNDSVVNPGSTTTCTKTDCVITINQSIKCSYNDNYLNSTENYPVCKEDLDARNLNCNGLKAKVSSCTDTECIRNWLTRIDAYDELIKRVCGGSGVVTTPVTDNGAEILAAENTLTSFFRNAESDASVWKDKDGNFNTARLASDLTAGVILGTVGGVVSGVVIKKKQVEKGFDALHCTVGGQTVADWGDIFNVGLRR